ncbi:MAG TPA: hypothetical protein VE693_10320 [Gaiellaceae bacterium]|nr:hypothetical protein [Gaiellaceae bacterium]
MQRPKLLSLALGLALGVFIAAAGASGDTVASTEAHGFVRWDLLVISNGVAVAGGTDVATDAAGDTLSLTGSGTVEPNESEAAGGGTWAFHGSDGETDQGVYYVTRFLSWQRLAGGNFAATGLIDGIGNGPGSSRNENEPTSGILRLRIHFIADSGEEVNGILRVNCHLPGTFVDVPEGIRIRIPTFDLVFEPTSGVTLFHRLR